MSVKNPKTFAGTFLLIVLPSLFVIGSIYRLLSAQGITVPPVAVLIGCVTAAMVARIIASKAAAKDE